MKLPIVFLLSAGLLAGCVRQAEKSPGTKPAADKTAGATSKPTGASKLPPAKATSRPATAGKSADVGAAPRLDEKVYDHFGAGVVVGDEPSELAAVTAKAKDHAGQQVRVTGKVDSVCKAKGCWMILGDGPQKVRITFKDYGFFMPKDIEGRTVILDGKFEVKEVSVAEVKHYLEDAGKHEEAAKVTEPRMEFRVVADGVALKKL